MWVGFLGSFATLMLRYPDREGVAFLLGTVLAVVANDVGAPVRRPPVRQHAAVGDVSPNKSWEGWAGGLVTSLVVCAIFVPRARSVVRSAARWRWRSSASVVGPIGDLCESMIKRDLSLKDMSSVVPGHGGVLDRFDAILFVLPAAYYLVELLDLAGA